MSTELAGGLVAEALAAQEAIIERGLKSFLEVGNALIAIRSNHLYLLTHRTFSEYCLDRWGFSDSRARQLDIAARVVTNVTAAGLPAPTNEGQARELARVPEPQRAEVWRDTLERTAGKPTAEAVRDTAIQVAERAADPAPPADRPKEATPERLDAARRRATVRTGRRTAERIVSSWRVDAVAIAAAVELGETDLVTPQMIDDLRAVLAVLEAQL